MATWRDETIVVTGATGHQGGAVTRHLLKDGWNVRALTRDPTSKKAQALTTLGALVVKGDMNDPSSLKPLFSGAYGVYSVQNPMISGLEGEIRQGKNIADAAKASGLQHLVYGSAGTGVKDTGIGSWESKLQIEEYMRGLNLPLTILRPMALMELMTDNVYYPPVSTWYMMPKLMGSTRKVVWLAADDLGAIAARVFAQPEAFIGKDLRLASDVQSIEECRGLYRAVIGKPPRRFPMPVWMFERFVGTDLTTMWRWLRVNEIDLDTGPTHAIHSGAMSVEDWLRRQHAGGAQANNRT